MIEIVGVMIVTEERDIDAAERFGTEGGSGCLVEHNGPRLVLTRRIEGGVSQQAQSSPFE
jgi:hypothetical protein